LINTSPEPFTNWSASFSGDVLVLSGLWAALKQPELFLVLFAVFMAVAIWVLPKLWYLIKTLLAKIGTFFGMNVAQPAASTAEHTAGHDPISALERLQHLRDKGALTEQEFEQQKNKILNGRPQ
jgi:hypothetical protein